MKPEKLSEKILRTAKRHGVEAEIYLETWESHELQAQNAAIDHFRYSRGQGIGIRLIREEKSTFISADQLDYEKLEPWLARSIRMLDLLPPSPFSGLAPPSDPPPVPDLVDPHFSVRYPEKARPEMVEHERHLRETVTGLHRAAVYFSQSLNRTRIWNSRGLDLSFSRTVYKRFVEIGIMQQDDIFVWGESSDTTRRGDLESYEGLSNRLVPLVESLVGGRPVPTGRRPVVFHPNAGSQLLHSLLRCLNGESVNRKTSFLSGRLNTQVAGSDVTLVNQPRRPGSPYARPFDAEGIPTAEKELILRGTLKNYLDNMESAAGGGRNPGNARRDYRHAPGIGWDEITMAPGIHTRDAILQASSGGLHLFRLLGFGLDTVTGNYSVAAVGWEIEKGGNGRAVSGITVAGQLDEMFSATDMIGSDLTAREEIHCPTFRVREMTVAGR